jgi:hypothetical protein
MQITCYSGRTLIKFVFPRQIFEKFSNSKFHENPPMGAELFHADGQTDVTKLIVAIRSSANAPKNR